MKKILYLLISALLLTGCSAANPSKETASAPPAAATQTVAPGITHPEGKVLDTSPPAMQGVVTDIDDLYITLSVEGNQEIFRLSDEARETIKIFAQKHDLVISPGSFIMIEYETNNGAKIAGKISIVRSN